MPLFYDPKPTFYSNNLPVIGGAVFFYVPGTTTKKNTYTDVTLVTTNANPVVLNSNGQASQDIYLSGAYKVVLSAAGYTDPPTSNIWTVDNVTSMSQIFSSTVKTGNYTVIQSDNNKLIKVDATLGNVTISLPSAATMGDGGLLYIKKTDSSANTVTIVPNGTDKVDIGSTWVLAFQEDAIQLICDGIATWQIPNRALTIRDLNNTVAVLIGTTASAVNYEIITDSATGTPPSIASGGSDTNIANVLAGKGTGYVGLGQATSTDVRLLADQQIADSSGNAYLTFSKTATAVNALKITNQATGTPPVLAMSGDTNTGFTISDSNGNPELAMGSTAAALNSFKITNKATGVAPVFQSVGQINTGMVISDSNGNAAITIASTAAGVNSLKVTNTATGSQPLIGVIGDSNRGLTINDSNGNAELNIVSTASALNSFQITNAATGVAPTAQSVGQANTGLIIADSNGNAELTFASTAAALNSFKMTNKATGVAPVLQSVGQANTGLVVADSNANALLTLNSVASAVNSIVVANTATGADPAISVTGDSNRGLIINAQSSSGVVSSTSAWNMSSAAYFKIPVGTAPTTDASGKIALATTGNTLNFYDGAASRRITPILSKSIDILNPSSSELTTMFFSDPAITITKMVAVLRGSATPSVTWSVRWATDRSTSGAEVVTGGTTTTSVSTGSVVTSFNSATITAASFLWFTTTAKSGTVNELNLTIFYTVT